MKKLESEIYFNRALLWMILAGIDVSMNASKWVIAIQALCSIYNLLKSCYIREKQYNLLKSYYTREKQ